MKRICSFLIGGSFLALSIAGCQNAKPMDMATMQKKADSIFNSKMSHVADSMATVCSDNAPMWIDWKADSLLKVKMDSAATAKGAK